MCGHGIGHHGRRGAQEQRKQKYLTTSDGFKIKFECVSDESDGHSSTQRSIRRKFDAHVPATARPQRAARDQDKGKWEVTFLSPSPTTPGLTTTNRRSDACST